MLCFSDKISKISRSNIHIFALKNCICTEKPIKWCWNGSFSTKKETNKRAMRTTNEPWEATKKQNILDGLQNFQVSSFTDDDTTYPRNCG